VNNKGIVYLVGAGPGRADLMTVRAKELLEKADIVAYDALISPSLLSTISPKAELIPIGYRGYGSAKLGYNIHPVVIEMAKAGKVVVRLKSGDPFIFGRGYQECIELKQQGIDFEVVPGVSSSLGAASFAGFPLTHRDFASDVVFASGHDLRGGSPSNSRWKSLAQTGGTIVIYMAASKIKENCLRLIEYGRASTTPAIYVAAATCGNEKIIQGTLETLADLTTDINPKLQALIIVGEVIHSRDEFNWRKRLPLKGRRLLVTRVREQASLLAQKCRDLGAEVIEAPFVCSSLINEVSLEDKIKNYKTLLFSDAKSVESFFTLQKNTKIDLRDFIDHQFITLDQQTHDELRKYCLNSIVLHGHCKEALARTQFPSKVLILGSDKGRQSLIEDLNNIGVTSHYLALYNKEFIFPQLQAPEFDGVLLPSSSSVGVLEKGPWESVLGKTPLFTIGEKTFLAAHKLSKNTYQAHNDNIDSLVQLVLEHLGEHHE